MGQKIVRMLKGNLPKTMHNYVVRVYFIKLCEDVGFEQIINFNLESLS